MKHEFTIVDGRSPWKTWFRTLFTLLALFGPGILLDSAAMQWTGFLLLVVLVFALVANEHKKPKYTIDEAIEKLKEMKND